MIKIKLSVFPTVSVETKTILNLEFKFDDCKNTEHSEDNKNNSCLLEIGRSCSEIELYWMKNVSELS